MAEDRKLTKIKPESFGDFDTVKDEFLPFLSLNSDQIPELLDWEPGGHYRLEVELRQDSQNINPAKRVQGSFSIVAYKHIPVKEIEDMSDAEFGQHQGQEMDRANKSRESSLSINIEEDARN